MQNTQEEIENLSVSNFLARPYPGQLLKIMHYKSILTPSGSGLRELFIFFLVGLLTALNVSAYIGPLQRKIPKLEDELGLSPTLSFLSGRSDVFFDPLNLATDENFARLREAELKHVTCNERCRVRGLTQHLSWQFK